MQVSAIFKSVSTLFAATALMALSLTVPSYAQSSKPQLIGSFGDWDAMTATTRAEGKTCYMISKPQKWTANKKNVRRGDIYMTVSHRPKFKVVSEVNSVVGYPLKNGSEVTAQVDGKRAIRLFTEGRGAWAYDPQDDSRMVRLMKAGVTMVVKGTSSRGTRTTDTYSLRGFTAAHNAITKACRG